MSVIIWIWSCAPVEKKNEPETCNITGFEDIEVSQPSGASALVVSRVEPIAEDFCIGSGKSLNCDFEIIIDARDPENVNAVQTS